MLKFPQWLRPENALKENKMRIYLKTKIMSLAAEARIIRNLENRCERSARKAAQQNKLELVNRYRYQALGLSNHRKKDVRQESRSALIAYGFLRGKKYEQIENKTHCVPDWKRIEQIVTKYAEDDRRIIAQEFAEWKDQAEKYLEEQKDTKKQLVA
jgi:NCAIR mutase (PurE)-related protein